MQLPMVTVPSAWTGLGRMSQARSRYQDRKSGCWSSSGWTEWARVWLQTTRRDNGEVGGWRAVAGRWRRLRFDAGSESDAKHNKAKDKGSAVLRFQLRAGEDSSFRDGAAGAELKTGMAMAMGCVECGRLGRADDVD